MSLRARWEAITLAGRWLIALALLLALSLLANVRLLRAHWQAEATCRTAQAEGQAKAIAAEAARTAKADQQADTIAADTRTDTRTATRAAQGETDARTQQIRTVVVTGDCRMPDGLPSLQPAIDEANAAAR